MHFLSPLLEHFNIQTAVISPGSRCAPLVNELSQNQIETISVVDERSAAFVALGIAKTVNQPVVLVCTSGSAVLNYAPAISEAYYQNIPLIVLSADRPPHWLNIGENQCINQVNVLQNICVASQELPLIQNQHDFNAAAQITAQTVSTAVFYQQPVQINCPFHEPIYNFDRYNQFEYHHDEILGQIEVLTVLPSADVGDFRRDWHQASKRMIIVGQTDSNLKVLERFTEDESTVIIADYLANQEQGIKLVEGILANDANEDLLPDVVLTVGGKILSKQLIQFLRETEYVKHWHYSKTGLSMDLFGRAFGEITSLDVLATLQPKSGQFQQEWQEAEQRFSEKLENINSNVLVDYNAIRTLAQAAPSTVTWHMGNSSVVRYGAHIMHFNGQKITSNRGVSGIDGSLSTAVGQAMKTDGIVICVLGDLSFFYDSNALFNNDLPENLKIVVLNNGGGHIFNLIPGPKKIKDYERLVQTKHQFSAESLANGFGVKSTTVNTIEQLKSQFKILLNSDLQLLQVQIENQADAVNVYHYLIGKAELAQHLKS